MGKALKTNGMAANSLMAVEWTWYVVKRRNQSDQAIFTFV